MRKNSARVTSASITRKHLLTHLHILYNLEKGFSVTPFGFCTLMTHSRKKSVLFPYIKLLTVKSNFPI